MKESYLSELEEYRVGPENDDIQKFVEDVAKRIEDEFTRYEEYHPAILGRNSGEKLYRLLVKEKPDIVVETGVCNGFSTSVILKALNDNQRGKLFSVDLPANIDELEDKERSGAVIPPGKRPGWAVPEELRDRWTLKEGNSYYELPKIFENLSHNIDLFLHDSGHSYETMMFEFSIAWYHLMKEGFLLSDNIDFSDAFSDFVEAKKVIPYKIGSLGLIQKKER